MRVVRPADGEFLRNADGAAGFGGEQLGRRCVPGVGHGAARAVAGGSAHSGLHGLRAEARRLPALLQEGGTAVGVLRETTNDIPHNL